MDTPPPRSAVPWLVLAAVAVLGGGALLWLRPSWLRPGSGRDSPPIPASPSTDDAFSLRAPKVRATGDPVRVERSAPRAGDVFRSTGRLSYRKTSRGSGAPEALPPRRTVAGTVAAERRVEAGEGGALRSVVTVDLDLELDPDLVDEPGDAAPRTRRERATIRFDEDARGGAKRSTLKVEGLPEDLLEPAEALVSAWTEPIPLPDRPVWVGEDFDLDETVDVEPLQRRLTFTFLSPDRPVAQAPVLGHVWVAAKERVGDDDVLAVQVMLRNTHLADVGPRAGDPVTVGYAAAWNDVRRVALAGGWLRACRLDHRHRIREKSKDRDVTTDIENSLDLDTVRTR